MRKQAAIDHFGNKAKIARLLKITRQAVHQWPDVVPIKQAWKLERLSSGELSMRFKDYR